MEVVFLGTGTSQGVPMIACDCAVCRSTDPRNHRTRASIHVVMDGLHVQVDAAPEFRLQCLREKINQLDFFILTHGHADHIAGMDDLRRFCDLLGGMALTVYSTDEGMGRVGHAIDHTVVALPLGLGAYVSLALREGPPNPCPHQYPQTGGVGDPTELPAGTPREFKWRGAFLYHRRGV